ncbi:MAG: SpoIIE family protein phosphatase [Crocinitomicaceae bacterium]|nr:SpoIIE family protein phosphatase [Crocinitomicaceae bacterium]
MKKIREYLRIFSALIGGKTFAPLRLCCEYFFNHREHKVGTEITENYGKYFLAPLRLSGKNTLRSLRLSVTFFLLTTISFTTHSQSNIQSLIDQGNQIYYSDPDSSYALCCGAEEEAKKSANNEFAGNIALCKARYMVLVTDYQGAAMQLNIAIQFFSYKEDFVNLSKAYSLKSILLDRIGEKEESTKVLYEAYLISKNHGDRKGEISRLTNLTLNFIEDNQADSAYKYLLILETLRSDIDEESRYFVEQNLGLYYALIDDHTKAIYYYQRAKVVSEKYGMQDSQATILSRLAESYRELNMLKEAEEAGLASYHVSIENSLIFEERDAIEQLILVFEAQQKFELAFEYRGRLIDVDDRINKLEKVQKLKEDEYRLSLKDKENQLAQKELDIQAEKLETAEANTQSIILGAIVFVVILVLGFTVMIYLRTKKLNQAIELSRIILEQKNREVNDSINYAKQIQDAILPPTKYYKSLFKDIFVFYRPKDIVAGDFFWFDKRDDKIFFAAADCTGHGVPGAMVSVICHSALNRSLNEFGLENPAEILEKTSELVLDTFRKSDREVKDGMDVALCVLDLKTNVLSFSGANNPAWIIKALTTEFIGDIPAKNLIIYDQKVLVELRGDKQPIGFAHKKKSFTNQTLQLEKGDTIYLSTDGYIDQFGGDKGKKLKGKFFKEKLLKIQNNTLAEQNEMIVSVFDEWKGELEQVDDVCVLGIRI